MLKAVIFDLDGVLVDSTELQWQASREFLKKHHKLDFSSHSGSEGKRIYDIILDLKDIYDLPGTPEELYKQRQEIFYDLVWSKLELFPEALPLLGKIQAKQLKIAMATSGARHYVELLLSKFPKLADYFTKIVTGDDVVKGKPYPDIYLKAAEELGFKPPECIVVEDSFNGIAAAKAAKMQVICIPNAQYPDADYSSADMIFDSLDEVAEAIKI